MFPVASPVCLSHSRICPRPSNPSPSSSLDFASASSSNYVSGSTARDGEVIASDAAKALQLDVLWTLVWKTLELPALLLAVVGFFLACSIFRSLADFVAANMNKNHRQ